MKPLITVQNYSFKNSITDIQNSVVGLKSPKVPIMKITNQSEAFTQI